MEPAMIMSFPCRLPSSYQPWKRAQQQPLWLGQEEQASPYHKYTELCRRVSRCQPSRQVSRRAMHDLCVWMCMCAWGHSCHGAAALLASKPSLAEGDVASSNQLCFVLCVVFQGSFNGFKNDLLSYTPLVCHHNHMVQRHNCRQNPPWLRTHLYWSGAPCRAYLLPGLSCQFFWRLSEVSVASVCTVCSRLLSWGGNQTMLLLTCYVIINFNW